MTSWWRRIRWTGAVTLAVTMVLPGLQGSAQTGTSIPAGFDLFETDPEQTIFNFQGPAQIPANFFAPGSDPFAGNVK